MLSCHRDLPVSWQVQEIKTVMFGSADNLK